MHTFFDFLNDDFMLLLNSFTSGQGSQKLSQIGIDTFQTFEATSSGDKVKSVLGQKVVKLDPDISSQERFLIGNPAAKELVPMGKHTFILIITTYLFFICYLSIAVL
jgi:hypothetical protein